MNKFIRITIGSTIFGLMVAMIFVLLLVSIWHQAETG